MPHCQRAWDLSLPPSLKTDAPDKGQQMRTGEWLYSLNFLVSFAVRYKQLRTEFKNQKGKRYSLRWNPGLPLRQERPPFVQVCRSGSLFVQHLQAECGGPGPCFRCFHFGIGTHLALRPCLFNCRPDAKAARHSQNAAETRSDRTSAL